MNINDRYIRNLLVPQCGEEGQELLRKAKVFVVGAGGLGSSLLLYLTAVGIGKIAVADFDSVEISNLQRQIIYSEKDIGFSKVLSATNRLKELNSDLDIEFHQKKIDFQTLTDLAIDYPIIIDCSDNFNTRYLINKFAFINKKTLIFAAVKNFNGHFAVFKSFIDDNPCYCCFNQNITADNPPLSITEKGIIGAVAGNLGSMQAIATIKEILMLNNDYKKILVVDFLKNSFKNLNINKNSNCNICN